MLRGVGSLTRSPGESRHEVYSGGLLNAKTYHADISSVIRLALLRLLNRLPFSLLGIATDSYRVNKIAIPPGLVVDVFFVP